MEVKDRTVPPRRLSWQAPRAELIGHLGAVVRASTAKGSPVSDGVGMGADSRKNATSTA